MGEIISLHTLYESKKIYSEIMDVVKENYIDCKQPVYYNHALNDLKDHENGASKFTLPMGGNDVEIVSSNIRIEDPQTCTFLFHYSLYLVALFHFQTLIAR